MPFGRPACLRAWRLRDHRRARDERIYDAVGGTLLPKYCLYSGDLPHLLQRTAPYLVQLEREDRFTRYLIDTGWGSSWATFIRTETGIKQLRRHLREFLRVRDESGKRLIFRYYDPRVLRVYLPTCWPAELDTFFGPISAFITEGEDPGDSGIPQSAWHARIRHAQLSGHRCPLITQSARATVS